MKTAKENLISILERYCSYYNEVSYCSCNDTDCYVFYHNNKTLKIVKVVKGKFKPIMRKQIAKMDMIGFEAYLIGLKAGK